ncbi:MAG: preprotein translocase subunit SecY [Candidatus Paceibacterota bacterium]
MNKFWDKLRLIITDANLKKRILFILGILVLFRFGASVPIPGVDVLALEQFFQDNQFFGLLNIFSGGGLANLSIVMLGVGPFITASIIMQLLTLVFPALKQMYHEEGLVGRRKVAQYSRLLTVPLALMQGFGLLILLERQGVLVNLTLADQIFNATIVAAGSILLMWLGELINEYGIGNGVSILIFAGIVSQLPTTVSQLWITFTPAMIPTYVGFAVLATIIVAGIVVVTEAERPIPITYAKRVRGMKVYGGVSTYLPIRVNNAGVMPIIFALSILLFPQMIINFLSEVNNDTVRLVSEFLLSMFNNPWLYASLYFILVFAFTYFYSAITFDPHAISDNLQKSGAFIPGVRPGRSTENYLAKILTRLTFVGAVFLGFVAMLPIIMQGITGIAALAIGGTGLLIVVSVVLDLVKKIEAQTTMREY